MIRALSFKKQFSLKGVEKDSRRRKELSEDYNFPVYKTINPKSVSDTDIFIIAVKPQTIVPPLKELKKLVAHPLNKGHAYKVVSIAAGIKIEFIREILGKKSNSSYSLIRVMPNTPALVGKGFSALSCGPKVSNKSLENVVNIFNCLGRTAIIDENLMDTVTAVSGSGPAYFFLMAQLLEEFAVENGMDRENARTMAAQTAIGSGKLMTVSDKSLEQLRNDVTSPGGTTEAALKFLESKNYDKIFKNGVKRARERSIELSSRSEEKKED